MQIQCIGQIIVSCSCNCHTTESMQIKEDVEDVETGFVVSNLLLPVFSLGLAAFVPRRFGVRLNVGSFGEFLQEQLECNQALRV